MYSGHCHFLYKSIIAFKRLLLVLLNVVKLFKSYTRTRVYVMSDVVTPCVDKQFFKMSKGVEFLVKFSQLKKIYGAKNNN